jgi:hypothetical protein
MLVARRSSDSYILVMTVVTGNSSQGDRSEGDNDRIYG